jgi:hypothetical protein
MEAKRKLTSRKKDPTDVMIDLAMIAINTSSTERVNVTIQGL